MQRFLHPVDVQPLELTSHSERILEAPGGFRVPRQAPPLVAVHQQLELLANPRTHRFQRLDVVAPVAAVKAQLDGGEALREVALGGVRLGSPVAQRAR
jgi:hypothetical protein